MNDQLESPRTAYLFAGQALGEDSIKVLLSSRAEQRSIAPSKDHLKGRPLQYLELICKVAHASMGGIAYLSSENELVEHITTGISDEAAHTLWRSEWPVDIARFVGQQRGPTRWDNWQQAPVPLKPPPGIPAAGAFLGIPLMTTVRNVGALYLLRAPSEPPFSDADAELVSGISSWLEQGIQYEEARLLAQINLLNQVIQETAGTPNLTRILKVALRELDRHLPLHISAVWLVAERPQLSVVLEQITALPGQPSGQVGLSRGMRLPLDHTPFSNCLRDGQAVYADLRRPEDCSCSLRENLAKHGATACFSVPLRAGDRVVGVLQSICTRPTGFTRAQIQLLYLVSDVLGPAISNCQLFERLQAAYDELRVTQAQLIQAEKLRALGELAGGMAHEFNNSLCGMLGFLELALVHRNLDPACRGYLESARTCALDAAQTVRRVQDFARQRGTDLEVQPVDLNELVRQTIELTRPRWETFKQAGGATITVVVVSEASLWVAGCPAELREVLTNLIFNAVDAMPQGGTLTVRTWQESRSEEQGTGSSRETFIEDQIENLPSPGVHGYCCFSVQDTGTGISPTVRQRLFEPFFTTKGERGNGLGLSVAFGIVSRYNGQISVDSHENQGTTFTVRLPAIAAPGESESKHHKADIREQKPEIKNQVNDSKCKTKNSPLHILVVEDEESIRRFLNASLTRLGHRAVVTADAHQALAAFRQERFDVVLTDLGLPGLDGLQLARIIAGESPQMPVILLTGWGDQINAEHQTVEGVRQVLGKPVSLDTLETALAEVIGQPTPENCHAS